MKHAHGAYIVTETCEAWQAWQAGQSQALLEVIRDTTGCHTKAQQSAEPIAAVKGWFHGECVIQALDPEAVLPAGMALYAAPQPVVDVNQQLVEALDACLSYGTSEDWVTDKGYAALLSAKAMISEQN
jgi:hypothetical protein